MTRNRADNAGGSFLGRPAEHDLGGFVSMGCMFGVVVDGAEDVTIKNFRVHGATVGFSAENSRNVTVKEARLDECRSAIVAHDSINFSVLDVEINGTKLTDFTGDFEFLTVISADEVIHLGQMLSESDVAERSKILRQSKLYSFVDGKYLDRAIKLDWLLDHLINLFKAFGNS